MIMVMKLGIPLLRRAYLLFLTFGGERSRSLSYLCFFLPFFSGVFLGKILAILESVCFLCK